MSNMSDRANAAPPTKPADAGSAAVVAAPAHAVHAPDALPLSTRVWMLVVPIAVLAVAYVVARQVLGARHAGEMAAAAVASFLGLGTTVIFGAAVLGETAFVNLSTLDLAIVVLVLNTALTVVYVGAFDLLEKIPYLGPRLARGRAHALAVATERVWIRRWATAGVALFVISPLPGSGVLGGTLVGRVVGLTRKRTFISVAVANAIVCAVYALGADALEQWMQRSRMTVGQRVGVFVAAVLLGVLLVKWLLSRNARNGNGANTSAAAATTSPLPPSSPLPPPSSPSAATPTQPD
jgi:uncharacterized membrane protein